MNAAQLTVFVRSTDTGSVIAAEGEVDLTTANQLREPLMEVINSNSTKPVVIDISSVDFIDSAGLALLVDVRKRLATGSRALYILLAPGRQPERVLKLGRFDTIMNLIYDINSVPATTGQ